MSSREPQTGLSATSARAQTELTRCWNKSGTILRILAMKGVGVTRMAGAEGKDHLGKGEAGTEADSLHL